MSFNYDKLKDAIHYVIALNTERDGTLDDVKLNKVLWYADAMVYMSRGQSITGATYIRKPRGPVAKYNTKAINDLLEDEAVREGKRSDGGGRWTKLYDSIKAVNQEAFSAADKGILDKVYEVVNRAETHDISERSHGDIWKLAKDREEIPLYTMFAEQLAAPSPDEVEQARQGFAG